MQGVNCSFLSTGYHAEGFCTFFGSCRVNSTDYMYQGGCGELASWGDKKIQEKKHNLENKFEGERLGERRKDIDQELKEEIDEIQANAFDINDKILCLAKC